MAVFQTNGMTDLMADCEVAIVCQTRIQAGIAKPDIAPFRGNEGIEPESRPDLDGIPGDLDGAS